MSTVKHVQAGEFLKNLRESLCDPQSFVAKKARKRKEWVGRIEKGEFTESDIEGIVRGYDLNDSRQKELRLLLLQELETKEETSDQGVEVGV